jgi:hypothetical protein
VKRLAIALVFASTTARAEDGHGGRPDDRPFHGSVGVGGSFVLAGAQGDRHRIDLAIDFKPRSRYGFTLAWRAIEPREIDHHAGMVMAGIVYEGAAARPRLVLDLHGDVGLDLDARAPLVGGGIRTTLTIVGPLGVVFDSGVYLVIDGIDDSRLHVQGTTLFVARW